MHLQQIARSLVNGSTAGSSTRLPLLNTSSGRPWFSPNRVPPTSLTSRSHSGPRSSDVLLGCPTKPEFQLEPEAFRTLVLERLRLPLTDTDAVCECGARFDQWERHRAACPRLWQVVKEQSQRNLCPSLCQSERQAARHERRPRMWMGQFCTGPVCRLRDKVCGASLREPVPLGGGGCGDWWQVEFRGGDFRGSAHLAFRRMSCSPTFAASLVSERWYTWRGSDCPRPDVADLFGEV